MHEFSLLITHGVASGPLLANMEWRDKVGWRRKVNEYLLSIPFDLCIFIYYFRKTLPCKGWIRKYRPATCLTNSHMHFTSLSALNVFPAYFSYYSSGSTQIWSYFNETLINQLATVNFLSLSFYLFFKALQDSWILFYVKFLSRNWFMYVDILAL